MCYLCDTILTYKLQSFVAYKITLIKITLPLEGLLNFRGGIYVGLIYEQIPTNNELEDLSFFPKSSQGETHT